MKLSTKQSKFVPCDVLKEKINRIYEEKKYPDKGRIDFAIGYNQALRDIEAFLDSNECNVTGADAFAFNVIEAAKSLKL